MAITKFRPEIWSARLQVALRKALIYTAFINRDYEGEIAEAGDTVRITSIGRPTIGDYVPNVTKITPEQVRDSQRTLTVDQAKFFAFGVDDVDARQAKGNVMPQAMSESAYALADVMDQFISSHYTEIQAANALGAISLSKASPADFYDGVLVPLKEALDNANVPTVGRNVAISPSMHGLLLRDSRFIKVNEAGDGGQALRNGLVGRAAGFDILNTNNAPSTNGSDRVVIAGNNSGITFAEQISKVEAYRPQDSFSDAVKGLSLYGARLTRPDALASAFVTVTA